jgi:hypothetical protein
MNLAVKAQRSPQGTLAAQAASAGRPVREETVPGGPLPGKVRSKVWLRSAM